MKNLLHSVVLGLFIVCMAANEAYAKACFLPTGGCPDEKFKQRNEYGENCPSGYRLGKVACRANYALDTVENSDGEICGICTCNISCSSGQGLDAKSCECKDLICPLGTVSSCADDACYTCKHEIDLSDGTPCYKNIRKDAQCPLGYTLHKPSAKCIIEKNQTCGSATCYKEKTCPDGKALNDNCDCVSLTDGTCPAGYFKQKPNSCYEGKIFGNTTCYKNKVCSTGYQLDENCDCVPYCEKPYQLSPKNKCDIAIDFGDHKCYQSKTCNENYTLNPATCECECNDDLIEIDGVEACVDCNEDGVNPCTAKGYKLCKAEDYLIGEGSVVCTCGNKEYYERCSTLEQCYIDQNAVYQPLNGCYQEVSLNNTSKYYDKDNKVYVNKGRYFVKEKCQKVDLSFIIHTAACDIEKDCNGHTGPAYGKIAQNECVGGVGSGLLSCGGADYFTSCQCPIRKNENIKANGGSCSYFAQKSLPLAGYYKVEGYDCTAGDETYVAVASCTAKKDCNGNSGVAYNKIKRSQCIGNVGNGEVECGGEVFVTTCQCPYKKAESINANGGVCLYQTQNTNLLTSGYYKVDGYNCTAGAETGIAVASCTANKDCRGNVGPAYGMKNCKASGLYPADAHPVVCGGIVYSELCKDSCNYDDTQASCRSKGKNFVSYCVAHTNAGDVAHGECVD